MLRFCDLFNPFRHFDNATSIVDTIKNQFKDYNGIDNDYFALLAEKNLSIDNLLPKCLEIAKKHANINDNIYDLIPSLTDNEYLSEILFSDIIISSLIFFRDFNTVQPITFSELLKNPTKGTFNFDYNNLAHSLSVKVPLTIKELFCVIKENNNSEYSITTNYPRLLLSIIQNSGDALFAKNKNTRHSFTLNQRNLRNTFKIINDYPESSTDNKAISMEEYFIYEKLYGITTKLDVNNLFLNRQKLNDNQALVMTIMMSQIILQPNIFGRLKVMNSIYNSIIRTNFNSLDSYSYLRLFNLIGFYFYPLCRSLFCGYLIDKQGWTDEINFNSQIYSIIQSEHFNKYCMTNELSFTNRNDYYYPLTRKQSKIYKISSKFWDNLAELHLDEIILYFKYPEQMSHQTLIAIFNELIETCGDNK